MKKKLFNSLLSGMLLLTLLCFTSLLTLAAPPTGYDQYRSNIPHGTVSTITYYSAETRGNRNARIYTPPGYSTAKKYSVLYLLHGVGGNENEWYNSGKPHIILDNLYSENKLAPMIVVFPNCKLGSDNAGMENFQYDLVNSLVPYIDAHYPTLTSRENRALAGLSMGGGQALNFGLKYMSTFANVGGFSPGLNTYSPSKLAPNPSEVTKNMKVLWLSAGDQDGALSIAQGIRDYFIKNNVPHTWYHAPGGHDWPIWKDSLYQFAQLIFKGSPVPTATPVPTKSIAVSPTPSSAVCTVSYSQNGASVNITIKNNGTTAINGWTLAWKFTGNQKITNLWNGTFTQSGTAVTVKNAASNSTIPAKGTVTFGFTISYSGTNAKPTAFTLNGKACQIQ